jgi:hypothetical protein
VIKNLQVELISPKFLSPPAFDASQASFSGENEILERIPNLLQHLEKSASLLSEA